MNVNFTQEEAERMVLLLWGVEPHDIDIKVYKSVQNKIQKALDKGKKDKQ